MAMLSKHIKDIDVSCDPVHVSEDIPVSDTPKALDKPDNLWRINHTLKEDTNYLKDCEKQLKLNLEANKVLQKEIAITAKKIAALKAYQNAEKIIDEISQDGAQRGRALDLGDI